jgi:hypothetical protein
LNPEAQLDIVVRCEIDGVINNKVGSVADRAQDIAQPDTSMGAVL